MKGHVENGVFKTKTPRRGFFLRHKGWGIWDEDTVEKLLFKVIYIMKRSKYYSVPCDTGRTKQNKKKKTPHKHV